MYIFSGVGAMEIVAMDMKLRGMYIARQLSFKGVSFKIEEVQYLTSGIPNNVFQLLMSSMQRAPPSPSPMQKMNPSSHMVTSGAAAAAAAAAAQASAAAYVQQEEDEVDYEEMGVAETYADYWPAKCKCLPTCSDYYYT